MIKKQRNKFIIGAIVMAVLGLSAKPTYQAISHLVVDPEIKQEQKLEKNVRSQTLQILDLHEEMQIIDIKPELKTGDVQVEIKSEGKVNEYVVPTTAYEKNAAEKWLDAKKSVTKEKGKIIFWISIAILSAYSSLIYWNLEKDEEEESQQWEY